MNPLNANSDKYFFAGFHYIGPETEDNAPLAEYLEWMGTYWSVERETYIDTDEELTHPVRMTDKHLELILKRFAIPSGLLSPDAIKVMSPDELKSFAFAYLREGLGETSRILEHFEPISRLTPRKVKAFVDALQELGGPNKVLGFLDEISSKGTKIQDYVGGGGWGHVLRVTNPNVVHPVALKILKPPYDQEWRLRFEREATILQSLATVPGVPQLINPIQEVQGLLFMESAFIDGVCLGELSLPVDIGNGIEYVEGVLKILAQVHENSIIHRDIHLGNVINGEKGIYLLDFGVARDEGGSDYYKTFRPVGAMSHCALEKWTNPSEASRASDIFSVGVMFYKLLTGKAPFWGDSYIDLYERIKSGQFRLPSEVDTRVPSLLDWVIEEMLLTSPTERTQDANAALNLLADIKPALNLWERHNARTLRYFRES